MKMLICENAKSRYAHHGDQEFTVMVEVKVNAHPSQPAYRAATYFDGLLEGYSPAITLEEAREAAGTSGVYKAIWKPNLEMAKTFGKCIDPRPTSFEEIEFDYADWEE